MPLRVAVWASRAVLLLPLFVALGCPYVVDFRQEPWQGPWPPGEKRRAPIVLSLELEEWRESSDVYDRTWRAYAESGLFRLAAPGEDAHVTARVAVKEVRESDYGGAVIDIFFGLVPIERATYRFLSRTEYRWRDGSSRIVSASEASEEWSHLLLIPLFPFMHPASVHRRMVHDLSRHSISEAHRIGLFPEPGADEARARGMTPLLSAAAAGRRTEVAARIAAGEDVTVRNIAGNTPLMLAADSGDLPTLRLLLAHGARADAVADDGRPTLHFAAVAGHAEAAAALIEAGADANQRDADGRTALMRAASLGDVDVLRQLVGAGARLEEVLPDGDGATALVFASAAGATEAVAYLVSEGAVVDRSERRQASLVTRTTLWGHDQTAAVLIEAWPGDVYRACLPVEIRNLTASGAREPQSSAFYICQSAESDCQRRPGEPRCLEARRRYGLDDATPVDASYWLRSGAEPPATATLSDEHPCGPAATLALVSVPKGSHVLEPEFVREIGADRTVLRQWAVPIDRIPLAIMDETLVLSGSDASGTALTVGPDGLLGTLRPAPPFPEAGACPDGVPRRGSAYLRCAEVPELGTGRSRLLAYEGPCT